MESQFPLPQPVQPQPQPQPAQYQAQPAQYQQQPAQSQFAQQPMQPYPAQHQPQFVQQPAQYQPQFVQQPAQPQPTRYKVHHTYIWLGSIRIVLSLAFALFLYAVMFFAGDAAIEEMGLDSSAVLAIVVIVILLFIVIVALVFIGHVLSHKYLWYELGAEEFSLYSGILNKKRVHVPYQRVQSVNQNARLIQRLCGVCTVHIDTAGGSANKAIVVPYLKNTDSEWLRTELFARKQAILSGQLVVPASTAQAVAGFPMPVAAASVAYPVAAASGSYPAVAAPIGYPTAPGSYPAGYRATQAGYPTAPGSYPAGYPATQAGYPTAPVHGAPVYGVPVPGAPAYGAPAYGAPAYGAPASAATSRSTNVLDAPAGIISGIRGVFGDAAYDTGAIKYEYGLSNKELFFTGLSNNSSAILVVFAILASCFGYLFEIVQTSFGSDAVDEGLSLITQFFINNLLIATITSVLVFVVFIWLMSILSVIITYGGFRARRRTNRIEVEHGIFQHRFHGVDVDRIQSVIIKQGFIRRLIGYAEISLAKIDAMVVNKENKNNPNISQKGLIVHPFVKMSRVPEILAGLLPEFADVPVDVIKLPKRALRRALIRRCILKGSGFWLAVCVAVFQITINLLASNGVIEAADVLGPINIGALILYLICFMILALEAINTILWHHGSSFAFNQRFMQITNSGFSCESVSFPRKKIQFGYTRTNPFQRFAKVATINVRTAAGIGGTTLTLVDAHREDAQDWLAWLKPFSDAE